MAGVFKTRGTAVREGQAAGREVIPAAAQKSAAGDRHRDAALLVVDGGRDRAGLDDGAVAAGGRTAIPAGGGGVGPNAIPPRCR